MSSEFLFPLTFKDKNHLIIMYNNRAFLELKQSLKMTFKEIQEGLLTVFYSTLASKGLKRVKKSLKMTHASR